MSRNKRAKYTEQQQFQCSVKAPPGSYLPAAAQNGESVEASNALQAAVTTLFCAALVALDVRETVLTTGNANLEHLQLQSDNCSVPLGNWAQCGGKSNCYPEMTCTDNPWPVVICMGTVPSKLQPVYETLLLACEEQVLINCD
ncbi:MAG: hypothetical protein FRX49_09182 [Trebouxia sp. A1-2]|nr:MAG: hypothetical protein FRX49_09182 [Trebouxia sp. A1-2]